MLSSSDFGHSLAGRFDRVVVFDLDDTLYLERDYVESGLRAVGAWAETQLGVAQLGSRMIERFHAGLRGTLFDDALETAGLTASPELIRRMLHVYRQHSPTISLAGDARRLLRRCPSGTGLAIITDGYRDAQKRKIRALGLHRLGVHLAICTDRWGRQGWKPSPTAFLQLQAAFRLPGTACSYIADNVDKDFHAPKRLGWSTTRVERPERLYKAAGPSAEYADRNIEHLDQIEFQ